MRRLPAARRRSQLLDVALDLFGTQGFHATSMDDIAESAGVTKPVVYQHFGSKADLYLELLQVVGADLVDTVATSASAESAPYHRVLAGFRAYFRFVGERTTAFRLLFGGGAREEDGSAAAVRTVEADIAATIARLVDVDLPRDHRDLVGVAIVGLAEVSSREWVLRSDPGPGAADGSGSTGPLDPAEGELLAVRLADLVWAGLRGLPTRRTPPPPTAG